MNVLAKTGLKTAQNSAKHSKKQVMRAVFALLFVPGPIAVKPASAGAVVGIVPIRDEERRDAVGKIRARVVRVR